MNKNLLLHAAFAFAALLAHATAGPISGQLLDINTGGAGPNTVANFNAAVGSGNLVVGSYSLALGSSNNFPLGSSNSLLVGQSNYSSGSGSAVIGKFNGFDAHSSIMAGENNIYDGPGGTSNLYIGSFQSGEENFDSAVIGSYIENWSTSGSLIVGLAHQTTNLDAGLVAGAFNVTVGRQYVLGTGLIAQEVGQAAMIVGQYNKSTPPTGKKFLFVIGNGTASAAANRANALEVLADGTIRMPKRQGDVGMGRFGNAGDQ